MKRRGVTLLELLVVLSIIGIATFFSYFSFSGYLDKVKLNAAAKETASQLHLAKEMARSSQKETEVKCQGN
ncbi:MAG: prepilin-type N-terminal cleavage/methylation domain-containing protein, partial [Candidatus Margulisiibacteriota bacterium]